MIETLTVRDEAADLMLIRPSFSLVLYTCEPRQAIAQNLVSLYERFSQRYGAGICWYKTNVMKHSKRLASSGLEQIAQMLREKKSLSSLLLGVQHHSGEKADDFALPAFDFFSEEDTSDPDDPVRQFYVRINLPPEVANKPDELVGFVTSCAATLAFDSGYAGFASYWNVGNPKAESMMEAVNRGWLLRFPGLAYGDPIGLVNFAEYGILGVNWLTLLSEEKLAQLGGLSQLESDLASSGDIEIISIPERGGVLIRAGRQPELGDVNRQDGLPLVRRVGQALSPLRVPAEHVDIPIHGMDEDESSAWYNRFFDADD